MSSLYKVILADPPWPYSFSGTRSSETKDDYKTMSIQEIADLPVKELADENSVLILWAIWNQLEGALHVMRSWGFEPVTGFPWIKSYDPPSIDLFGELRFRPTWGMGAWVRGCSEPILIGKRGNAQPPVKSWLGLVAERMQHSRKPLHLHAYAESMEGPYLELFARKKQPGWDVFGNQVDGSIRLPNTASTRLGGSRRKKSLLPPEAGPAKGDGVKPAPSG